MMVNQNGKLEIDIAEKIDDAIYQGTGALEKLRLSVGMGPTEFWTGIRNTLSAYILRTKIGIEQNKCTTGFNQAAVQYVLDFYIKTLNEVETILGAI